MRKLHLALLLVLALVTSACGARLSDEQMAAATQGVQSGAGAGDGTGTGDTGALDGAGDGTTS